MIGLLGALAAATLPQARTPESVLEGELTRCGFSIEKARELAAEHGLPFPLVAEELVMAHDAGRSEVTLPDLSWVNPRRPVMGRQEQIPVSEGSAARISSEVKIRLWTGTASSSERSIAVHTADPRPAGAGQPAKQRPLRDRSVQKMHRKRRAGVRARRGW